MSQRVWDYLIWYGSMFGFLAVILAVDQHSHTKLATYANGVTTLAQVATRAADNLETMNGYLRSLEEERNRPKNPPQAQGWVCQALVSQPGQWYCEPANVHP